MYEIIFRCDASNKKNVGSGHVFRSLAIADFFCKNFNLNKKKILFVLKKNKYFSYVSKIIKNKNYVTKGFLGSEIELLNKYKSKSLIIDRVKIENQKNINKLINNFSRIVCLDSENKKLL